MPAKPARFLKSQLGWILTGRARTDESMQRLGVDLRELQLKVDQLGETVANLAAELRSGPTDAQLTQLESAVAEMRSQLRTVADDLGDRVGSLSQYLNSRA